jgi:hypothetical protein
MESSALTEEIAAGMEKLAALIRAGTVKVNECGATRYHYIAASEAEVTNIADDLKVPAEWNESHTHLVAALKVGGRMVYEAVWITREHMARYNAETTYAGCVEPAEAETAAA